MIGETVPIPEPRPDVAPTEPSVPEPRIGAKEIGGRDGPDPTRYGDWEKNGRCIDF
ncbi:MAG: DUF1674 domain-containing protein [Lysobacteraceae bacterium]